MKVSLNPGQPLDIAIPENARTVTLRVWDIAPAGRIFAYCVPSKHGSVLFDAEHSLQRIECSGERIYIHRALGALSCNVEIVEVESKDSPTYKWDIARWDEGSMVSIWR